MIKNILSVICIIVGILGALICGIWAMIIQVKNPDATEMRIIMDNPELLIISIICFVLVFIGGLTSETGGTRRW